MPKKGVRARASILKTLSLIVAIPALLFLLMLAAAGAPQDCPNCRVPAFPLVSLLTAGGYVYVLYRIVKTSDEEPDAVPRLLGLDAALFVIWWITAISVVGFVT